MKKAHVTISPKHSQVLVPWAKLSKERKRREIVRYAQLHHGSAVTLNLGVSFSSYLSSNPKPMREVGKRLNAELHKLDLHGLPLLMVLEATKLENRLHLHGVYIANGIPKDSIQAAMRRAVGYITGRSGSRQFKAKSLYAADGWTNYLEKDGKWTRRLLKLPYADDLWWVTHSLTRLARENYEAIRKGETTAANSTNKIRISG